MVDISRAKGIDGFMGDQELTWLAEQAQTHHRIVELGSYHGRSTRAMADNTPGFVVAIDTFYGPKVIAKSPEQRAQNYPTFLFVMDDLLKTGKVRVIKEDHATADVDFEPDMVFIDGSHEYQDVKRDILKWYKKLAPDGLMCGMGAKNLEGVKQAIDETMEYKTLGDLWHGKLLCGHDITWLSVLQAVEETLGKRYKVVDGLDMWVAT